MEFILGVLTEFMIWIGIELLLQYTGAFLLWLYYKRTLSFSYFLHKKDKEKALKTGRIGCFFYVIIVIIVIIIYLIFVQIKF